MKRKLLTVTAVFIVVITIITAVFLVKISENPNEEMYRMQLVRHNEIRTISEEISAEYDTEQAKELLMAVERYEETVREAVKTDETKTVRKAVIVMYFACVAFTIVLFLYIYIAILRPFDKMAKFADKIACGNFDIPLNYERSNYFGAFTWAFDNMRKELISARQNEKKAILKNKTVIATISHDIKTPITSIRAYSESLAENMGRDSEKDVKYLSVIIRKCDEVTDLTNDLLLHSISDLDKLKMEIAPESIKELLIDALADNRAEKCNITFDENSPDSTVMLDRQRFGQVIENLIGNSIKYAGTDIDVLCRIDYDDYIITIKDYGDGIPDENMPFVFGRFYRGNNVKDKPGTGLGLYITEYIMKKHKGSISLFNREDGLEAVLKFPIYRK